MENRKDRKRVDPTPVDKRDLETKLQYPEASLDYNLPARFMTTDTREEISTPVLLDSGCKRSTIDTWFVKKNNITTKMIDKPYKVYNADLSLNGWVKHYVSLEMTVTGKDGVAHRELIDLQVANLGSRHNIFIGKDWLNKHNPVIDWINDDLTFHKMSTPMRTSHGPHDLLRNRRNRDPR